MIANRGGAHFQNCRSLATLGMAIIKKLVCTNSSALLRLH